jgi:hypothetical protein
MLLDNLTIRNNSIYVSEGGGAAVALGTQGEGHVVVSNSVHYAGTDSDWSCLSLGRPAETYETVSNNLCYRPNSPNSEWVNGHGTLSQWQASSGHGMGSLETDPRYSSLDRMTPDLSVDATSPLLGAGHPTQSAGTDLFGLPRDAYPDIGAYEYAH